MGRGGAKEEEEEQEEREAENGCERAWRRRQPMLHLHQAPPTLALVVVSFVVCRGNLEGYCHPVQPTLLDNS